MKKSILYTLLVINILLVSCHSNEINKPQVKAGTIDLQEWNFLTKGSIKLNGAWHFYWKQLPREGTKFSVQALQNFQETKLPKTWTGDYFNGKKLSEKGYGTYRLQIQLSQSQDKLALYIPDTFTAMEIWANGKKIGALGVVGTSEKEAVAKLKPVLVDLPNNLSSIDLVIPVSCFEKRIGGGFKQGIQIGKKEQFLLKSKRQLLIESISVGSVMVIAIISLLFFFLESKKRIFIYFFLFILCGVLRITSVGEGIITLVFPEAPFSIVQKLRIIPFYIGMAIGGLYLYRLFPLDFHKKIVLSYVWISIGFSIYVLVTPTYIASFAFIPYQIIALLGMIYVLVIVILANLRGRPYAKIILYGFMFSGLTIANDILIEQQIIDNIFLSYYGFVMFVFMQSIVTLLLYREKKLEIISLSRDLKNTNIKLELSEEETLKRVTILNDEIDVLSTQIDAKKEEVTQLMAESISYLKSKEALVENLKEISKEASTISLKSIIADLKSEALEDSKLLLIKNNLDELHHDFYKTLQRKHPDLTKTDIEICSYIKIGLERKEIARLRNTSLEAVKKSRYRIRKKMNLATSKELNRYLQSL